MKLLAKIVGGLVGGYALGIALSSLIGILGITLFDSPLGIKFLPVYTACLCAVIAPMISMKRKNR